MNRLADQSSLYLRQHAENPVEWYPWSAEALEKARAEQKPILLSIGYSACHWCHVMAHESFENPQIASLMNERFVNIKVDREERPDLDRIYQLAHQGLTQRAGGWPLTMVLDPDDQTPFFGGTYFPPESRHGMPAFPDLLQRIATFFEHKRDELASQNQAMRRFLDDMSRVMPGAVPELDPVRLAVARLAEQFDEAAGGFGGAPKFPHPPNLELLLAAAPVVSDRTREELFGMVDRTLEGMARGGLFDQLGGGFFRYCVDGAWTIPHFEKMLYDNALLLPLYARRAAETGSELFDHAARLTVEWLCREMNDRSGLFYASLDADSEGQEGRHYLWTPDQVREALDEDDAAVAIPAYGLDQPPNFEETEWHLLRRRPLAGVAEALDVDIDTARSLLDAARRHLLEARSHRARPGRDEKLLVAWNALMIAGLARAGRWLGEIGWIEDARRAFDALVERALADGRLTAVVGSKLPGYLDDQVYLLDAALELLNSGWDEPVLERAIELADALLEHYQDREDGGFYFTADDHERLVQRPRSFNDESTPAGNGVAVSALLRLGHLLGETRYLDAAERALRAAGPFLERAPQACPTMLRGLVAWHQPPAQLIVRGGLGEPIAASELAVYAVPEDSRLAPRFPLEGDFTAYLCEGRTCSPPMKNRGDLLERVGVYLHP